MAASWPWWPSFTADARSAPDNNAWTLAAPPSRPADAPPLSAPITALVTPPGAPIVDVPGNPAVPPPPKPGTNGGSALRLGEQVPTPIPQQRKPGTGDSSTASEDGVQRDPTQPGPNMRQLLAPRAKAANIPAIQLKARIVTAGQVPVVILDIDRNLYLAKLGDEFSPAGEFSGLTIRVSAIDARQVRLDVTPLGRSVIIY